MAVLLGKSIGGDTYLHVALLEEIEAVWKERVALAEKVTVQKGSESKIILDETGAERLTGMGDMLVKTAQGQLVRVHGARVNQDDIAAAVKTFSGARP